MKRKTIYILLLALVLTGSSCKPYVGKYGRQQLRVYREEKRLLKSFVLGRDEIASGSFGGITPIFLTGSYSKGSVVNFYFYAVSSEGEIELIVADSRNVKIYEDELSEPYVITYTLSDYKYIYDIHIPPNSINFDINIDLDNIEE